MEEKITVQYFRVPEGVPLSAKGPTPAFSTLRYRRGGDKWPFRGFNNRNVKPLVKGGITKALIELDGTIYQGIANCSASDNFSYRVGRELAIARARREIYDTVGIKEGPE